MKFDITLAMLANKQAIQSLQKIKDDPGTMDPKADPKDNSPKKTVNNYPHIIDEGKVSCGRSFFGFKFFIGKFNLEYLEPPLVFFSTRIWKARTDKSVVSIHAFDAYTNTTHVTIGCFNNNVNGEIVQMYVHLISFPSDM